MFEAFGELVGVPSLRDETYSFLVVEALCEGQTELFLDVVVHTFFEGEAVAVVPVTHLGGQHEVEVDEPLQFLGQVDAFGETE